MKALLFILSLLTSICGFSQLPTEQNTTRALVIGISDYQDENIPDLKYANKDAEAFAAFLQSPAGGALPKDHIMLLTNKEATTGAIASAMDWLIADSKEGDKVIIYFSGHGDVETRTKFQRGFLLTYDSPPSNYLAGAFALIFLQDIISTLSDQGIQVIMISDACRAGKLAGSEIGGAQATAANLSKQFANEIKILSCQPNEFSLEGEQWGGGRGAFSFHLIDALTGMADGNEDFKVNLLEVNRYLEEVVPTETDPHMQIPMTVGSKGTILSYVDDASLAELKSRKEKEQPSLAVIETKGFEEVLLADTDSVWQNKYEQFTAALESDQLLEPKGRSAYDLYLELSKVPELKRLHGIMKRNLAAKLQEESQQAINAYLRADNEEMAARSRGELKYTKFVQYLEKAAELLGEDHYMYKSLKAKQYYFDAVDTRIRFSSQIFSLGDSNQIWRKQWVGKIDTAMMLEQNAAFIYYENHFKSGKEGLDNLNKAIDLAPNWAVPYSELSTYYGGNASYEEAYKYAEKAIKLSPEYGHAYMSIGRVLYKQGEFAKAEKMLDKAIELSPGNVEYKTIIGFFYKSLKRYEEAEKIWLEALQLSPNDMNLYNNLSTMYRWNTREHEKRITLNLKRLEVRPTDGDAYADLGISYNALGQVDQLRQLVKEMEEINSRIENWEGQMSIGNVYKNLGDLGKAKYHYEQAAKDAPESHFPFLSLASMHRRLGNIDTAYLYFDTTFFHNRMSFFYIDNNWNLTPLTRDSGFVIFAQKAINQRPNVGFGYRLMGMHHSLHQEYEKATSYFEKALERSPNSARTYFHYGKTSYLSGQKEKADSLFRVCLQVSSQYNTFQKLIGSFYTNHSEKDNAIFCLKEALKIDAASSETYTNLAKVYYYNQESEKAHEILDKGIALQKSEGQKMTLMLTKGVFFYYDENFNKSISYFQQIEKQYPLLEGISILFLKLKEEDWNTAEIILNELLRLAPNGAEGNHIKCRIKIKQGLLEEAIVPLSIAVPGLSYDFLQNDRQLDPLREMPEFKKLMQQHFPEKVKN